MTRLLTLDLGNSALSACLWSADRELARLSARGRIGRREEPEAWLERRLAEWEPDAAALSWVAEDAAARPLAVRLEAALGPHACLQPAARVENRCVEPRGTGIDRLHAARGAFELEDGSALVVDAGTALTVDALAAPEATDRPPLFLGGAIAPGPDLAARALGGGAARLFRVRPRAGAPALGRDTESALVAGVSIGFVGAARELVRRVADEAGLPDAPVVLCGGAAGFLLAHDLFDGRRVRHEPALVHVGLASATLAAEAPPLWETEAPRGSSGDGADG